MRLGRPTRSMRSCWQRSCSGGPAGRRSGDASDPDAGGVAPGRDPAGRPGRRRRRPRPPRPALRLPGARPSRRRGGARRAGAGAVRRPAGRRLPAGAGRGHRPRGTTRVGGQGGVARAGADRRGRGAVPGGGRPVRRACWRTSCGSRCRPGTPGWRPRRRAEPGRPDAPAARARAARTCSDRAAGWARYPRGPALLDALAGGPGGARRVAGPARRVVGGPARRGRGRHRAGRAAAPCSSCPTSATSPPCTRPARPGSGRRRSSR